MYKRNQSQQNIIIRIIDCHTHNTIKILNPNRGGVSNESLLPSLTQVLLFQSNSEAISTIDTEREDLAA